MRLPLTLLALLTTGAVAAPLTLTSGSWTVNQRQPRAFALDTAPQIITAQGGGERFEVFRSTQEPCDPAQPGALERRNGFVVGLAGPFLTLNTDLYDDCAPGHQSAAQLRTLDLSRRGAPARLTGVFGEGAVLKALRSDPYLRELRGGPSRAGSIEEALSEVAEALDGECLDWSRAILDESWLVWDVRGAEAEVRVLLPYTQHRCAPQGGRQLELTLPVPAAHRAAFAESTRAKTLGRWQWTQ